MKILYIEYILLLLFIILDFLLYFLLNYSLFQFICNNINFIIINLKNQYYYLNSNINFLNNNLFELNNNLNYYSLKDLNLILDNENINLNNVLNNSTYLIFFDSFINLNDNSIYFYSLQKKIYLNPLEPTLIFYRLYNNTNNNFFCYSFYYLYPKEIIPFFIKLQCFCMENSILNTKESLDLPVLFYIKPILFIYNFRLNYLLFLS
jgi:hypothetical protein